MEAHSLNDLLAHPEPCMLGAFSMFFFNIWNIWSRGDFVGTMFNFAQFNEEFLAVVRGESATS